MVPANVVGMTAKMVVWLAGVLSWWVGMAPLAKIAFTDIGSGNTGFLAGVPYNLTTGYFPWPYVM